MSATAVTDFNLELGTKDLLIGFLNKWFDGSPHTFTTEAGVVRTVPGIACSNRYGQGPTESTRDGKDFNEIRLVIFGRGSSSQQVERNVSLVIFHATANFWVSVRRTGEGNGELAVAQIAQVLWGLLKSPAVIYELSLKGVSIQEPGFPAAVSQTDFSKRMVSCSMDVRFTVPW